MGGDVSSFQLLKSSPVSCGVDSSDHGPVIYTQGRSLCVAGLVTRSPWPSWSHQPGPSINSVKGALIKGRKGLFRRFWFELLILFLALLSSDIFIWQIRGHFRIYKQMYNLRRWSKEGEHMMPHSPGLSWWKEMHFRLGAYMMCVDTCLPSELCPQGTERGLSMSSRPFSVLNTRNPCNFLNLSRWTLENSHRMIIWGLHPVLMSFF